MYVIKMRGYGFTVIYHFFIFYATSYDRGFARIEFDYEPSAPILPVEK